MLYCKNYWLGMLRYMVQALYTTGSIVDISYDTVHCTLTCGMSNRNQMGSTTQSICSEMGSVKRHGTASPNLWKEVRSSCWGHCTPHTYQMFRMHIELSFANIMSGIVSQWSGMRSQTERHTLHTWDEATMACPLVGFFGWKNCVGDEEGKKESRGKDCTWAVGWVMSTIEACVASRQCTYMGDIYTVSSKISIWRDAWNCCRSLEVYGMW